MLFHITNIDPTMETHSRRICMDGWIVMKG